MYLKSLFLTRSILRTRLLSSHWTGSKGWRDSRSKESRFGSGNSTGYKYDSRVLVPTECLPSSSERLTVFLMYPTWNVHDSTGPWKWIISIRKWQNSTKIQKNSHFEKNFSSKKEFCPLWLSTLSTLSDQTHSDQHGPWLLPKPRWWVTF